MELYQLAMSDDGDNDTMMMSKRECAISEARTFHYAGVFSLGANVVNLREAVYCINVLPCNYTNI